MAEKTKENQEIAGGIPAYKGFGIGKLHILGGKDDILNAKPEEPENLEEHLDKLIDLALKDFRAAKKSEIKSLSEMQISGELPPDYALDISIAALEDGNAIRNSVLPAAREGKTLHEVLGEEYRKYSQEKMTEAVADIFMKLLSVNSGIDHEDISHVKKGAIVATGRIGMVAAIGLMEKQVSGIVSSDDENSHLAMLAKENGIPFIAETGHVEEFMARPGEFEGQSAVIDSYKSKIILNPDDKIVAEYKEKKKCENQRKKELESHALEPCVTQDGHHVKIYGNRNNLDFEQAAKMPIDGIGLVRLESIYAASAERHEFLDAGTLSKKFEDACLHMSADRPVTIRLLDINNEDKTVDDLLAGYQRDAAVRFDKKGSPLKGMAFLLANRGLLEVQVESVIRSNKTQPIKALLPYVQNAGQVKEARKLMGEVHEHVKQRDPLNVREPSVSAMIETTDLTRNSNELEKVIKEADEISIGGNDLSNEEAGINRYGKMSAKKARFSPVYHPNFIRALVEISDLCKKHNKSCSMCGDCASDPDFLPVLLALGIKPVVLTQMTYDVRERAKQLKFSESEELLASIKGMKSSKGVYNRIQKFSERFASNVCAEAKGDTHPDHSEV